ncbi:MAG: type II toxin-antitoxin system Phd/YefM family antitoxin [Anaerolineae bacterium]
MKIAPMAEVKVRFGGYLDECQNGPVLITRNGRPVAALVPVSNDDEEEIERLLLAHSPRFRRMLEAAQQSTRDGEGVSNEALWRALGKDEESHPGGA